MTPSKASKVITPPLNSRNRLAGDGSSCRPGLDERVAGLCHKMVHGNPYACELAAKILKDLFGDIVAVRNSMMVLLQHNYVSCYRVQEEGGPRGPPQPHFVYEAQLDKMLQTVRKPWFLLHIQEEMGEAAGGVIEVLLENGRLRVVQIVTCIAAKRGVDADNVRGEVHAAFISLAHAQYIERAPPCGLPRPPSLVHPSVRKRRSTQAARDEAVYAAACAAAYGVFERERFKLPQSLVLDSQSPTAMRKRRKKMKPMEVPEPEALPEDNLLWRVNHEEFNRALRHQTCIDMVTAKINADAGYLLRCMLDATRSSETRVNEDTSRPVSETEIANSSDKLCDRFADIPDDLAEPLRLLHEDQLQLVSYLGEQTGGAVYVVNLSRIVECAQLVEVETSVRDRFGLSGLRIWRLLLLKCQLEQKEIADLAMLDAKEARSLLYRMMKAGYVGMQGIPRTADHAATRTFYTWNVSLQSAVRQQLTDLYRCAFNVYSRLMHELHEGKELLEILAARNEGEGSLITENQEKQATRLRHVVRTLESRLMKIDGQIAIMTDFDQ